MSPPVMGADGCGWSFAELAAALAAALAFALMVACITWCSLDHHHQDSVRECLRQRRHTALECDRFGELP